MLTKVDILFKPNKHNNHVFRKPLNKYLTKFFKTSTVFKLNNNEMGISFESLLFNGLVNYPHKFQISTALLGRSLIMQFKPAVTGFADGTRAKCVINFTLIVIRVTYSTDELLEAEDH